MRTLLACAAAIAALTAAAGTLSAAPGPDRASAAGVAALVRVPGQPDAVLGAVSAPPGARSSLGASSLAGVVSVQGAATKVATGPGAAPRSSASAELRGVSLFGGEITVARVVGTVTALADADGPDGSFSGSTLEGLAVGGGAVAAVENARVELGDYGFVVMLEQAVQREDGQGDGYRGFVAALHVYLTKEHGGLPAGSEIVVGYADAAVRSDPDASEPANSEGSNAEPADGGEEQPLDREPDPRPPGAQEAGPPPIVRDPPPEIRPDITGGGFVFPVYGPSSFSDDFAAPRADTIWHHGNDIFAATGAPVLAVSDGELFLVGWNTLGGHRLWLRDGAGNEYYYAHLSAYSPAAVDGARVRAGDVIGFVGQSGVAGGVPHLHFEIHPSALLGLGYDGVINPYTYLLAWQARQDREFGVTLPPSAGGVAPEPGAELIGVQDISTASGLDPEAVLRTMRLPLALGVEAEGVLEPQPPDLIGAPVGFPGS